MSLSNQNEAAGEGVRREDFVVLRAIQTRWADLDTYSHVNNAVHYEMMDTAVNGWLMEATGTDIRQLDAVGWVVETSCRYLAQLRFPTVVDIGVGLERVGRSSVVYRLALFGSGDAPLALARFVHVYVDRVDNRPRPIPLVIRRALEMLEKHLVTSVWDQRPAHHDAAPSGDSTI